MSPHPRAPCTYLCVLRVSISQLCREEAPHPAGLATENFHGRTWNLPTQTVHHKKPRDLATGAQAMSGCQRRSAEPVQERPGAAEQTRAAWVRAAAAIGSEHDSSPQGLIASFRPSKVRPSFSEQLSDLEPSLNLAAEGLCFSTYRMGLEILAVGGWERPARERVVLRKPSRFTRKEQIN